MIRRVALTLTLTLLALAGVGLGTIIAAETQPPAALLIYPDRQEAVLPDGAPYSLDQDADLRVAHAHLALEAGTRFVLKRHHASPINGWQVTLALEEGQINGQVLPKLANYRLTLEVQSSKFEIIRDASFVVRALPNGTLHFGVLSGDVRFVPRSGEPLMLREKQGVSLAANGAPKPVDWAVLRATAYRLDGAPLALPLLLVNSQGVDFAFETGQVIGVPADTYRLTIQTLIPYIVEPLQLTAEQPLALTAAFGEVTFLPPSLGTSVTTAISSEITLRLPGNEVGWKIQLGEPLIAAPGEWLFFVQYANNPEQRVQTTIPAIRRIEIIVP